MFYTKELIEKIKRETNLLELVSEYTEVTKCSDELWTAKCPHPDHDDSNPSFRICRDKDGAWSWYCGGCHCGPKNIKEKNYGSDCYAFVSWISDYKGSTHVIGWYEAVQILAKRAEILIEEDQNSKTYEVLRRIAYNKHLSLLKNTRALNYLHHRGLKDFSIKEWLIGLKKDRISFPLFSKYKQIQGESSRAITWNKDSQFPKYINSSNSKIFHKGSYLYGLHKIDVNFPEIRITEGQFDVILAYQYGAKNFVATLGTAFTSEHVKVIKSLNMTPCICMDSDPAGAKATKRIINLLMENGIYAKVFILPDQKDLAEIAYELEDELEEYVVAHSMSYWEYMLLEPLKSFNAQITDLRKKVLPEILHAKEGVANKEDYIIMRSYVKEKFGVEL